VGGDLVEYCDPTSIDSIAEACLRLVTNPAHRESLEARIAMTRLRSWDDVAADLVKAITQS
jgi:glycosyltransferase involved in cell wall biosynthesis